jgi:hypothetical protein
VAVGQLGERARRRSYPTADEAADLGMVGIEQARQPKRVGRAVDPRVDLGEEELWPPTPGILVLAEVEADQTGKAFAAQPLRQHAAIGEHPLGGPRLRRIDAALVE